MGLEEVADLLRKFVAERTLLECTLWFPDFKARLRGRLDRFSADELRIFSDDTNSELVVRFRPGMEFEYSDARALAARDDFEGSLVVVFRRGEDGNNDFIGLTEIVT